MIALAEAGKNADNSLFLLYLFFSYLLHLVPNLINGDNIGYHISHHLFTYDFDEREEVRRE